MKDEKVKEHKIHTEILQGRLSTSTLPTANTVAVRCSEDQLLQCHH